MIILKLKSMFFVVGALAVTAQMDCYGADAAGDGAAQIGVVFPGPQPGKAQALQAEGSIWTLENQVILATWANEGGTLRPVRLMNKLTGTELNQRGAELFRLAAAMPEKTGLEKPGFVVAVRLDANAVVAQASKDGESFMDLASFPRADFPGEPKLVRIGKMNLKAQAKDNPGDIGVPGEGLISELNPAPAQNPSGRFAIKAKANQAATQEYPFPAGCKFISCRIDKDTDQGMSWSPALALIWEDGQRFLLVGVREKAPVFNIMTAAGEIIKGGRLSAYPVFNLPASRFRLTETPKMLRLSGKADGLRIADRIGGGAIEAGFTNEGGIRARWRAELRDDSNYIRQTLELSTADKTTSLSGIELTDARIPSAKTIGSVPGCPVAGGGMFFGVELPGAQNALNAADVRIGFGCKLELSPTQAYTFGAVAGVAPEGQLRRAFLYYMERERARPSKPFLHYNCWYDLGTGLNEEKMMDVVARFNEELVRKRGVPVLSYLADDGWDNPGKGLWEENAARFPQGFRGMKEKMDKVGARLGVWISPLGGYGGAKERTALARKMGLIPENSELDLACPAYKKWFQDRCLQLMREAGVNAFKWDRAGSGVSPHFMALLDIAHNLRAANPDVFINVTVGTWPSPFWLNHVDTTWRDGSSDVGWAGKGDDREKWITFRDGYCRRQFVERSPLYPLNSVMHHGLVHGRAYQGDRVGKSGANLKNDARAYFANGAMLQEMYLTPSMMTTDAWDRVAEAAKWAHANADVLLDAHWVGGDPLKLEVYGYAAWNPRKATLMLRNPDDKPQPIALDAATVFELPSGAPKRYALTSPYKDQRLQMFTLEAGQPQTLTLEPFEVIVFDANKTAIAALEG